MKKYNKINRQQVLDCFKEKNIINRKYICNKYNCSMYSTRREVEDLVDEGIIKVTNHGYIKLW